MLKSLGFQQNYYGGDHGMYMETHEDEQFAYHEESWGSKPTMHMKPAAFSSMESEFSMSKQHHGHGGKLGGMGNHGMFHDGMHGGHGYGHDQGHGYGHGQGHAYGHDHHANGFGKKYPFGSANNNNSHHQFSKYNSGGNHHDYYSEETEFEAYSEEHHGHNVASKVDAMKYEHQIGGGNVGYANPYGGGRINNHMNMNHLKPHGGGGYNHKIMWTAKGV